MNTRNSTTVVWLDTHRVTLAEMEADFVYPMQDTTGPEHTLAMVGKPARSKSDNKTRAKFWGWLLAAYFGAIVAAVFQSVYPS